MITIITLTYNNYNQLVETLNSVPEDPCIESIVVNGGSCKSTLNYLKTYHGIVINEPDEGISDAFNKGILKSTGKYIMVLNSGDRLINKEYLFKAARIMDNNQSISFVHSNILFEEKYAGHIVMTPRLKNIGRGMPYLHQSMIVRRSVFDMVGLYNKEFKISMDYDLVVRMEKQKLQGYYLNEDPAVKMDGKGISNTKEIKTLLEAIKSLRINKRLDLACSFHLFVRIILFTLRKVSVYSGGKNLYVKLMRLKYA